MSRRRLVTARTRALQAEAAELQAAIRSEEDELQALQAQARPPRRRLPAPCHSRRERAVRFAGGAKRWRAAPARKHRRAGLLVINMTPVIAGRAGGAMRRSGMRRPRRRPRRTAPPRGRLRRRASRARWTGARAWMRCWRAWAAWRWRPRPRASCGCGSPCTPMPPGPPSRVRAAREIRGSVEGCTCKAAAAARGARRRRLGSRVGCAQQVRSAARLRDAHKRHPALQCASETPQCDASCAPV